MNTILKTLFLGLFCTLSLSSCHYIHIKVSPQGLISYYNETLYASPDIFIEESELSESYCSFLNTPSSKVLISNGLQLNECLQTYEESLVYIWDPKCKAEACLPLDLLQMAADKKGLELFIASEYYDSKLMSKAYKIDRPIIGMDISHYKTNLTHRYLSKFLSDVTRGEIQKLANRLLYFKDGKYEKSVDYLEDI